MSSKNYYVPVLKWKRGEQKAIENLSTNSLDNIMPLIEIAPIEFDYENNRPKKTIDEHISNIPESILTSLKSVSCFIDGFTIEDEELLTDGTHAIKYIIENSIKNESNVIPVTGIGREISYDSAIKNMLDNNTIDKLCIRIEESNFSMLNSNLQSILNKFDITPDKCHIILDLKEVKPTSISSLQLLLPMLINNMINLNDWISITLVSTAFPVNLGIVPKNSAKILLRSEYDLWKEISIKGNLIRPIQFGDYAISNPEYTDMDPRYINMSGNIRYTIDNGFLIYKGITTKSNGFSQMIPMCKDLVKSKYFSGEKFSWGDTQIYNCANGIGSTGNAETWRRIGTNHHIEFVIDQLSKINYFPVPLYA
ncbi:beta family protein [uncultured Clostridium sp.]|uniref:beta family protein n=1 Tax=uncultured Clostridium sp. TaxID=59620 RepID=UPI0025F28AC0|nr:beta family protein [uncultured Clostridium sp.]